MGWRARSRHFLRSRSPTWRIRSATRRDPPAAVYAVKMRGYHASCHSVASIAADDGAALPPAPPGHEVPGLREPSPDEVRLIGAPALCPQPDSSGALP